MVRSEDTGTVSTRVGPCNKSPQEILIEKTALVDRVLGARSYKCWEIRWMSVILNNKKISKPKYKISNLASRVGTQTHSRKYNTIRRLLLLVHWFFHLWGWKQVQGLCFGWWWKAGVFEVEPLLSFRSMSLVPHQQRGGRNGQMND